MAGKRNTISNAKKNTRIVQHARMYVHASFNNTIVTLTDEKGTPVASASTGGVGFSGARKATPYAATMTIEKSFDQAREIGVRSLELYVKGAGPGRDAAVRVARTSGIALTILADVTPLPHNGTKARKIKHG